MLADFFEFVFSKGLLAATSLGFGVCLCPAQSDFMLMRAATTKLAAAESRMLKHRESVAATNKVLVALEKEAAKPSEDAEAFEAARARIAEAKEWLEANAQKGTELEADFQKELGALKEIQDRMASRNPRTKPEKPAPQPSPFTVGQHRKQGMVAAPKEEVEKVREALRETGRLPGAADEADGAREKTEQEEMSESVRRMRLASDKMREHWSEVLKTNEVMAALNVVARGKGEEAEAARAKLKEMAEADPVGQKLEAALMKEMAAFEAITAKYKKGDEGDAEKQAEMIRQMKERREAKEIQKKTGQEPGAPGGDAPKE